MSKSNTFENDFMKLVFQNTAIADIGDAAGLRATTTAGSLYWSLHTADPGEAGTAVTSECAYLNYLRVAAARSSGGFTVTNSVVNPAANVDFAQAGAAASETATHFGIVNTSSGAGKLLYSGIIGSGPKVFTADTADLFTSAAHGLSTDDRVVFEAIEGLSLPTGVTQGTRYFVLASGLTSDVFKVSTTSGGSALDVTVAGGGLFYRSAAIVITENVTPRLTTATAITEG